MVEQERRWATGQDLLELSLLDVVQPSPEFVTDYTVTPPRQVSVDNEVDISETVAARLALRLNDEDEGDDDLVRVLLDDDNHASWAEYKYQYGLGNRYKVESPSKVVLDLTYPINGEDTQTLTFKRLTGRDIRKVNEGAALNDIRQMLGTVARSGGITFESALLLRIGDLASAIRARDFLILAGS